MNAAQDCTKDELPYHPQLNLRYVWANAGSLHSVIS
jgi:hypothetical protein